MPTDTDAPTEAEVKKIRAWECSMEGHVFDVLVSRGSHHPGAVRCLHCGETWPVVKLRRHSEAR